MQIPRAIKCEEGKKKIPSNYSSIHTVHCTFQLDFKNTRCKNLHCIRSQKSPSAFLPVVHILCNSMYLCYGSRQHHRYVCPDRKNLLAKWRVRFHLIFFSLSKSIAVGARLLGFLRLPQPSACTSSSMVYKKQGRSIGPRHLLMSLTCKCGSMACVSVVLTKSKCLFTLSFPMICEVP